MARLKCSAARAPGVFSLRRSPQASHGVADGSPAASGRGGAHDPADANVRLGLRRCAGPPHGLSRPGPNKPRQLASRCPRFRPRRPRKRASFSAGSSMPAPAVRSAGPSSPCRGRGRRLRPKPCFRRDSSVWMAWPAPTPRSSPTAMAVSCSGNLAPGSYGLARACRRLCARLVRTAAAQRSVTPHHARTRPAGAGRDGQDLAVRIHRRPSGRRIRRCRGRCLCRISCG